MNENWQKLPNVLQTLPVNTSRQQALINAALSGAKEPAILVVGTEESDPHSLLPGMNPFEGVSAPACPVWCRYGETFSIRVQNQEGEYERFYTAVDYRTAYGRNPQQVMACTVNTPYADPSWPPLLFAVPTDNDPEQLRCLAALADGCIFTAYAEAGTVGEAASVISRLMPVSRAALVLTHVENTFFPNDMLSLQIYGGQLVCLECDNTLPDQGGPTATLRNAVELICSASAVSSAEDHIAHAHAQANQLMDTFVQTARTKHQKMLSAVKQYEESERTFRAMASGRRYAIRALVKEEHQRWMQQDISALIEALKQQLPDMITEVVTDCQRPKEILKNLLSDYVSSTLNAAITAALENLMDEYYLPEINNIMQDTVDDYTRIAAVALQSLEDTDVAVAESFMHLAHLSIGDFHTPLASFLADRISSILFWTLLRNEQLLFAGLLCQLERLFESVLANLVDALVPTKAYCKSVGKAVVMELDTVTETLMNQISVSLFPRLEEVLDKEYNAFIDECALQLQTAAEQLRQQAQEAQEELARSEQAAGACRQAL